MIQEWMETYEEEFEGSQPPLLSKLKILTDTGKKIGTYRKIGMSFFENLFRPIVDRRLQIAPARGRQGF
jgi:hypothetical protein